MELNLLQELAEKFEEKLKNNSDLEKLISKTNKKSEKWSLRLLNANIALKSVLSNDYSCINLDFFGLLEMFIGTIEKCSYYTGDESKKDEEWKKIFNAELLIYLKSLYGIKELNIEMDSAYELYSPKFLIKDLIFTSLINELDAINGIAMSNFILLNTKENVELGQRVSQKRNGGILDEDEFAFVNKSKQMSFRKNLYNNWFKNKIDKIEFYSIFLAPERNYKTHVSNLSVEGIDYRALLGILQESFGIMNSDPNAETRRYEMMIDNKIMDLAALLYLFIFYKELMNLKYENVQKFVNKKANAKH